jgi:hypothetical protein
MKGVLVKISVGKRVFSVILAIGIAGSSLSLAAGTAFASSSSSKHPKVGSTCTKSEVNQKVTVGKTTLTCKEITLYEWEK